MSIAKKEKTYICGLPRAEAGTRAWVRLGKGDPNADVNCRWTVKGDEGKKVVAKNRGKNPGENKPKNWLGKEKKRRKGGHKKEKGDDRKPGPASEVRDRRISTPPKQMGGVKEKKERMPSGKRNEAGGRVSVCRMRTGTSF